MQRPFPSDGCLLGLFLSIFHCSTSRIRWENSIFYSRNWYNRGMIPHFNTPWLMITGGDIVLPGGEVLGNGTVLVNQGMIQAITDQPPASLLLGQAEVSVVDATGHWITPGLIDQHLHGAFGIDFNQSSIEAIHDMLLALPRHGITGVVPTVISAPKLDMVAALATLEEVIHTLQRTEARVFGTHLEGPFLHPQYRGAHPASDLLSPSQEALEGLLSPSLKRMTVAPELDSACEMIETLVKQGILCSIGHSGADYPAARKAILAGASCATHLFNAMKRIDHRNPGIVEAVLLEDNLFAEFIADGHHLSPVIIRLALKTKPFEKLLLISDCNALTGLPMGSFMLFGKQRITACPEGPKNEEGNLAGSSTLLTDCVRNLVDWEVLPFPQAVQLATLHPAQYLGESPLFGRIATGAVADIVLWRKENLQISNVFLGGEPVEEMNPIPRNASMPAGNNLS